MDHGHGHDHGEMWTRSDAVELVRDLRSEALDDRATRSVDVGAGIAGKTLAEDLVAEQDVPAHSHATMDGFAFDATDDYPLELTDASVFPEDDPPSIDDGQAVRVATGAAIPPEANAVLKKEEATVEDGHLEGTHLDPGTYVYERASNVAGGETLFERGERLAAKDGILLQDLGHDSVRVYEPFSVGILATGTEIHEGRTPDLDSGMLAELVAAWGHDPSHEGTVPDEYDRVETRIRELASEHDVVLTTGGTSVGKKDHVIRALRTLGEVPFHRVKVRPGKPIAGARLPDQGAYAFAIPGKPVGAYVITTLVARPFFAGETALSTVPATVDRPVEIPVEGFDYAIPVLLEDAGRVGGDDGTEGGRTAVPLGQTESPLSVYESVFDPSVLSSSTRATRADGFALTTDDLTAGQGVRVVPFPAVE